MLYHLFNLPKFLWAMLWIVSFHRGRISGSERGVNFPSLYGWKWGRRGKVMFCSAHIHAISAPLQKWPQNQLGDHRASSSPRTSHKALIGIQLALKTASKPQLSHMLSRMPFKQGPSSYDSNGQGWGKPLAWLVSKNTLYAISSPYLNYQKELSRLNSSFNFLPYSIRKKSIQSEMGWIFEMSFW